MIFTFENHPLSIINIDMAPRLIIDNRDKVRILDEIGIDILNLARFDEKFMRISPEDFILKLISCYRAKGIVVGFNYRFGYKNQGDIELLKYLSCKFGFELIIMSPVKYEGEVVSSSRVRHLIGEGEIEKSNLLLTRPFSLSGIIIKGKKIGRTIGFPTINLDYNKEFILPAGGVYCTIVQYKNKRYRGITNIGYNPTVHGRKLNVETHILDFNIDIYGEEVKLYFLKKIRDEKKFNSLDELKEQLNKDKLYALNEIKERKYEISKNNLQLQLSLL